MPVVDFDGHHATAIPTPSGRRWVLHCSCGWTFGRSQTRATEHEALKSILKHVTWDEVRNRREARQMGIIRPPVTPPGYPVPQGPRAAAADAPPLRGSVESSPVWFPVPPPSDGLQRAAR
jgi:hypothetical protein